VIVTQLKNACHHRARAQLAIGTEACPSVWGKTPQIFIAWPAKLSYESELNDVQVTRVGTVIKVRKQGQHPPHEPNRATDFMDYLSRLRSSRLRMSRSSSITRSAKASPIAALPTTYFLARVPSLQGDLPTAASLVDTYLRPGREGDRD